MREAAYKIARFVAKEDRGKEISPKRGKYTGSHQKGLKKLKTRSEFLTEVGISNLGLVSADELVGIVARGKGLSRQRMRASYRKSLDLERGIVEAAKRRFLAWELGLRGEKEGKEVVPETKGRMKLEDENLDVRAMAHELAEDLTGVWEQDQPVINQFIQARKGKMEDAIINRIHRWAWDLVSYRWYQTRVSPAVYCILEENISSYPISEIMGKDKQVDNEITTVSLSELRGLMEGFEHARWWEAEKEREEGRKNGGEPKW